MCIHLERLLGERKNEYTFTCNTFVARMVMIYAFTCNAVVAASENEIKIF